MRLSVFDLFKIGIGPSSSHTVGPMVAANRFASGLRQANQLPGVKRVQVDLYGSLALTGRGHATDIAVLLGLAGEQPAEVDADCVAPFVERVRQSCTLPLAGEKRVEFREPTDLLFHNTEFLPRHPNGIRFTAFAEGGETIAAETYYSVGGGFVVRDGDADGAGQEDDAPQFMFHSASELLELGREHRLSITEMMWANEIGRRPREEVGRGLDRIWSVMEQCIERGCRTGGVLPGGLGVQRRAAALFRTFNAHPASPDPMAAMDWVSLCALAVNEENAAGGRVVTAPTNGAAGVIPAVLAYARRFLPGVGRDATHSYLLTASAIGMLFKRNASLSAAEMGCQGEIGVACSMAAAGLAAIMGGTNDQIENAAEIGMEHNLGLTCDPVGGLVQVPCIERNAMGAIKAINAARLAVLHGDGTHRVPLDRVIETMRQTGLDMHSRYKETSLGGLALNMINC
ncbi:MAG: L-serine ammonia-lyase [Planctomycetaceae bacterium]|nr:L-serine ammonia-lyase [Planctomycetaceae bacterium]